MPKLRQFSGKEVVKIFKAHGFEIKNIVGSHVRMTLNKNDFSYHVTIPLHDSLKKGTLHSILKDFELCFGKDETKDCFFG